MRTITKAFALGGAMVAAERMMRRKRSLKSTRDLDDDLPGVRGISDVDPTPLMGLGEAVDPEGIEHAHKDIPDQRSRLPRRP